jgi:FtsH-binding integral membrane protein
MAFLRKTYALLGGALIAFAALTGGMMVYASDLSWRFSSWAFFSGPLGWIVVFGLVIGGTMWAQRLAMSETSRGVQYLGLSLAVVVQVLLMQPILWLLLMMFGDHVVVSSYAMQTASRHYTMHMNAHTTALILQAVVITLSIFVGLTAFVFVTRKDFSFLRGILSMAMFALIGVALASWIFGFSLGALYCGIAVLVLGGYILYETSLVMSQFPPSAHVAAATMLFTTVATLFRLVLQLLMMFSDRR